jgi:pimeloyl-ACP methyl ester carboxylesterase
MTTIDSARDMDRIRAALGQQKINYYGFSYGTYLGQVYSTLFPQRVRRIVLDSNVDPRTVWYQANLNQDFAFDKVIEIWFGWVATYNSVYHLGATESAVEHLFYATEDKLRFQPADGKIGPAEWTDVFTPAAYNQAFWTALAGAFAGYVHNAEAATLEAIYVFVQGLGNDNTFAVYNAVQCTDTQWPLSWKKWQRDNSRIFDKAPFLTWDNVWFNAPCLTWPAPAHEPLEIEGGTVAPLLIDETLDAATPFPGSLEVRKLFPKSSLIALPGGTSHANSLSGDACLDNQIADYLATGKLPARKPGNGPDTTCAPLPLPVPKAATTTTAAQTAQGRNFLTRR